MRKPILISLGFCFLGLGAIGAILPVMPTTCFVLAAAACFARSSDRFYHWLLSSRTFGPMIHNWQTTRSMPRKAKIMAISAIGISGATSAVIVNSLTVTAIILVLLAIPIVIILMLPTTENLKADVLNKTKDKSCPLS